MHCRACVLGLAALFVSGLAHAQSAVPALDQNVVRKADPWDRVLSVNAQGGFLAGPLGFAGVGVDVTPVRWFTLAAGVGVGGSLSGPQEALMARVRTFLGGGAAFAIGGGLSTGPYEATPINFFPEDDVTTWKWKRAWWTNIELSAEHRSTNGLEVRVFAGIELLANHVADQCVYQDLEAGTQRPCGTYLPGGLFTTTIPYLGASVGYAFDL